MQTRQEKEQAVGSLRDSLAQASTILAVDYRGLTVAQSNELRARLRGAGDAQGGGRFEYRVAKNTLLKRATAGTQAEGLHALLSGPTAIALARDEPSALARVLVDFAKDNDKFRIKGGVVEGDVVDLQAITQLATLPSRDELRAMLAGTLQSPLAKLAGTLQGLLQGMRTALEQRQQQLEQVEE